MFFFFVCVLILYVLVSNFQSCRDESTWIKGWGNTIIPGSILFKTWQKFISTSIQEVNQMLYFIFQKIIFFTENIADH